MTNNRKVYWGYCTWAENEGRVARGFVMAGSKAEAKSKARKRVLREGQPRDPGLAGPAEGDRAEGGAALS